MKREQLKAEASSGPRSVVPTASTEKTFTLHGTAARKEMAGKHEECVEGVRGRTGLLSGRE